MQKKLKKIEAVIPVTPKEELKPESQEPSLPFGYSSQEEADKKRGEDNEEKPVVPKTPVTPVIPKSDNVKKSDISNPSKDLSLKELSSNVIDNSSSLYDDIKENAKKISDTLDENLNVDDYVNALIDLGNDYQDKSQIPGDNDDKMASLLKEVAGKIMFEASKATPKEVINT